MMSLDDILDRTAQALLAGDLVTLGLLTSRLEDSIAAVSQPDRATADRWQSKARRNARLLEAATRGVKAARRRAAEIIGGPVLTTYDARGQRASIKAAGPETAHRV
jgi:hypothetical protein